MVQDVVVRQSWPQAGRAGPKIALKSCSLGKNGSILLHLRQCRPRWLKDIPRWSQDGPRWSKMFVSCCRRFLSWAFSGAPWLTFVLLLSCFRSAFVLPSLCLCVLPALLLFCICFTFALVLVLFCFVPLLSNGAIPEAIRPGLGKALKGLTRPLRALQGP